jgi:hypothetical protein
MLAEEMPDATEFVSPRGNEYRIIHTDESDPSDNPSPEEPVMHRHGVGQPVRYFRAEDEAPTAGQIIRLHDDGHTACIAYFCQATKTVKEAVNVPHGRNDNSQFYLCVGEE